MKIKKYINMLLAGISAILVIVGCIGCSGEKGDWGDGRDVGGIPTTTPETTTESLKRYNSEKIVVVTAIDTAGKKITVQSVEGRDNFSLSYNGGTVITSKYGTQLLMEQVDIGEVVRVGYNSGTQKLIEMQEYDGAWENTSVTRWDVDYDKQLIVIGSSTYAYDGKLFINSNGKSLQIREISGIDHLTVRGIGNNVYSVVVDQGHGYVKLTDTKNYIGGIVEVGDRISTVIVEDMVIAAPEGGFQLTATIDGVGGSKEVNVVRGQETVVSLGSFEQAVTRYGTVRLTVSPEDAEATVTIDGEEMDYSDYLSIAYGTHTMKVTSNNYDVVEKKITISSPYTNINVNMDAEDKETETETSTENSTSNDEDETTAEDGTANNGTSNSSNGLICITAPTGVKVYYDGAYVGTSPLTIGKEEGEHTIIFKKDGYVTKSYTIDVSDDDEDMILSFPDMMQE